MPALLIEPRLHTQWQRSFACLLLALLLGCTQAPLQRPDAQPLPAADTLSNAARFTIARADEWAERTPQPMKVMNTQGRLPDDPIAKSSQQARQEWYGMLALAQAAQSTGNRRYADALEAYFSAWANRYEPQGNPIDETHFHQLVLAYETGGQHLSVPTREQVLRLFRRMADVTFDGRYVRPGTDRNNWQSHRVKVATALAFVLQDAQLIEWSFAAFRQQVARNINAQGVVLDFRERDALHYVTYSLEPMLTAALIAQQHGKDWYRFTARSGASLNAALAWLAPYADGEKIHLEFARTTIPFDRTRAQAGVAGFSGPWNPAGSVSCYQLAARLDAKWIARAVRLGRAPPWVELAYPSALIDAAQVGLPTPELPGTRP